MQSAMTGNGTESLRKTARRAGRQASEAASGALHRTARGAKRAARSAAQEALDGASAIGQGVYDEAFELADRSLGRLDRFVNDRPVTALAGALAIGVVLGFMARR